MDKFALQDQAYEFPYHHIPYFEPGSGAGIHVRRLRWGLEYLCHLRHLAEVIAGLQVSSVLDVGCGDGRLLGL